MISDVTFPRKGKTKLPHSDIWHCYTATEMKQEILSKECHYFTKNFNKWYRLIGPIVHDPTSQPTQKSDQCNCWTQMNPVV